MASSIRGSQISFKNVFYDEATTPSLPHTKANGRSKELHDRRNECLLERYYFTGRITKQRYEAVIEKVAAEFFITDFHCSKIILQNNDKLISIKMKWKNEDDKKVLQAFTKKWPQLVWAL